MTATPAIATDNHGLADFRFDRLTYWWIFVILIILTALTVMIAFKRFDDELANVSLALLIALTKGSFVARYFMHLKFEGKLIWLIFLLPLGLCVILTLALVPDIAHGRDVALNDWVGMFIGANGGGPQ